MGNGIDSIKRLKENKSRIWEFEVKLRFVKLLCRGRSSGIV